MPNRIIREGWLESERIDKLDPKSEVFYLRLLLRADDFGRYHAHPQLLKSNLFPLREDTRSTDMSRCLAACENAGLVRCFEANGGRYLEILNFRQRTRAMVSRFPQPVITCPHPAVIRQTHDGHPRTETETETDSDSETYSETEAGGTKSDKRPSDDGLLLALVSPSAAVAAPTSDEDWLNGLTTDPAFTCLDVRREHAKMAAWCRETNKQPTRRRFVNWLNRCDKPTEGRGGNAGRFANAF